MNKKDLDKEKINLAKNYKKMIEMPAWKHLSEYVEAQVGAVQRASIDPGFSGRLDPATGGFITIGETYLARSSEARGMKRLTEFPDLVIKQAESLSKKLNTKESD
ncbi:MAG: hypothetical protein BWY74_00161 [Firmicutes bacterium ADurb.Bin419]|nr:MAG: hypothetical protein BWY74_00161 [Firmicutes bacterium ADurb.Bin419]